MMGVNLISREPKRAHRPATGQRPSALHHCFERPIELSPLDRYALLPLSLSLADLLRLLWEFAGDETLAAERFLDGSQHLLTVEHADRLREMTPPLQIDGNAASWPAVSDPP